jgi:DNA helicase HerA-like ATPase
MLRREGAQALRYILYFDEIYGYCPPVSSPASKKILLRLIKTSRAFGLGLILTTQNPSDVDYKVISNANIRCIGRLPTEQDFKRIRAGLNLQEDVYSRISSLATGEFVFHVF